MTKAALHKVIGSKRSNSVIIREERRNGRCRCVPAITAPKAHRGKLRLHYRSSYLRVVEVRDDAVSFPRAKIRQPLIFKRIFFKVDAPFHRLLNIGCYAGHDFNVIGRSGIVNESDPTYMLHYVCTLPDSKSRTRELSRTN